MSRASNGHTSFCRQTLIGGNYELIDKYSLTPNPDYHALALFNELAGSTVLAAASSADDSVRAWAFCTRDQSAAPEDATLLSLVLLNYGEVEAKIEVDGLSIASEVPRSDYVLTADELHSRVAKVRGGW